MINALIRFLSKFTNKITCETMAVLSQKINSNSLYFFAYCKQQDEKKELE